MKPITVFIPLAMFFITTRSCATMDARHQMDTVAESPHWLKGPTTVALGQVATLEIPEGLAFLDRSQTRTLLGKLNTETSGDEVGFIASEFREWSVVITFREVGFVSDQGWDGLDTAVIVEAMQTINRDANLKRERNGWATIQMGDWELPPAIDALTHRIVWAVRTESAGATAVNRVVNVLGRSGIMQMILVDPHRSESAVAAFTDLVRGLAFRPGERYEDWRPGNPIAIGGLASVVSGMDVPERTASVVENPIPARESRTSTIGDCAWLIGIVAALTGFFVGRLVGRHRRKHRFPDSDGSRGRGNPAAAAGSRSSVLKAAANVGAGVVGAEECSREIPIGPRKEAGRRRRRCDAYSFYERLTRDLHWTIKY